MLRLLKAPFKLLRSVYQARRVIKSFKPDVVLGMGGFASGPGGIAAKLCAIPLVLHEQNAIAGMTNRYLAKVANRVMVAFDSALRQHQPSVVGNPVRHDILALQNTKQSIGDQLNILIVGGSLGAQVLNQTLPETIALLDNKNVHVIHQAGRGNGAQVANAYGKNEQIEVSDFIDDMAAAYQWADLVVCRAGALTVSEIAVLALPAIFVPLPYAVDDHQTKNAAVLADIGAAIIMPQQELTPQSLAKLINKLTADDLLATMSQGGSELAKRDAGEQVALVCAQLAGDDHQRLCAIFNKNNIEKQQ